MTMPNFSVEPGNEPGQALYEQAASAYYGPKTWPKWERLTKKERKRWAAMEKSALESRQ